MPLAYAQLSARRAFTPAISLCDRQAPGPRLRNAVVAERRQQRIRARARQVRNGQRPR